MRLFSCLSILSPKSSSSSTHRDSLQHSEKVNGSPRSFASGFDSKHIHHDEENEGDKRRSHHHFQSRNGILQPSSSPPPLGYTFSIIPSSNSYDRSSPLPAPRRKHSNDSISQSRRRATGSPTSTTSRVSFTGSFHDQRRVSAAPSIVTQIGTPTAFQSVDRGQGLCSRVYTSDNAKVNKKRSSWR